LRCHVSETRLPLLRSVLRFMTVLSSSSSMSLLTINWNVWRFFFIDLVGLRLGLVWFGYLQAGYTILAFLQFLFQIFRFSGERRGPNVHSNGKWSKAISGDTSTFFSSRLMRWEFSVIGPHRDFVRFWVERLREIAGVITIVQQGWRVEWIWYADGFAFFFFENYIGT